MHKLYCMHVSEKEQFKTRTNIVISFPLSPFLCSPPHNSSLSLSFSLFYISLLLSSHRFFTYVSTSLTIKPIYIVMLHIFLNIENKQYVFQFNFQTCFQQYFSNTSNRNLYSLCFFAKNYLSRRILRPQIYFLLQVYKICMSLSVICNFFEEGKRSVIDNLA